jgi:ABC-type transporter Mla maintaining outer membrane lipid asymmetry ATPase subunit MlaF
VPQKVKIPIEFDVQDLYKSFGRSRVLSGVTLTVRRGEVIALIGGSGCGKTGLLKY